MNGWSDEETGNLLLADDRNLCKVEKSTRDGMKVDSLPYAGNNLGRAQEIFATTAERRPRTRLSHPRTNKSMHNCKHAVQILRC